MGVDATRCGAYITQGSVLCGRGRITLTALAVGRGRKRQRAQTLCVYLRAAKEQAVKTDEMR